MAVVLGIVAPGIASAFGVSPGKIEENRLVPGSTVTRTISLVQGNPTEDVSVVVLVDSSNMKDWMIFDPGLDFVIPAGVQQFPFKVTIAVPKDAAFGNYSAYLRVRTKPKPAEEGGSVAVSVGARVDVNVTVGDNIIEEFNVKALAIQDITEGDPLTVSARIENTGNVPTGPDSASFELFDKFGSIRLAFGTIEGSAIGTVPPFGEKTLTLTFPIDLRIAPGQYRGDVKIFGKDGTVIREVKTGFSVREKTFFDVFIDVAPYVGGALLILIIGVVVMRRARRKRMLAVASVDGEGHRDRANVPLQ
jgi:hypothetical protein